MLRSISEQSRKSVESVLIAVASRLVAGYSNPGSIHFLLESDTARRKSSSCSSPCIDCAVCTSCVRVNRGAF